MKAVATTLSNNVLFRAKQEKIPVSPMKLQKLLYYVCVKYAQQVGESPLSEQFEVWKYGPVLPSVYSEFKPFGSGEITSYALNAKKEARIVSEAANPILRGCLDEVWGKLKRFSAVELSNRTHQPESGWYKAFQRNDSFISTEDLRNDGTL